MIHKFPVSIRIVSAILVVTFLFQDIAWAHPDPFNNNKAPNNNLAPASFFTEKESLDKVLARIVESVIDRNLALLNHKPTLKDAVLTFLIYRRKYPEWFKDTGFTIKDKRWNVKYSHVNEIDISDVIKLGDADIAELLISIRPGGILRYFNPEIKTESPDKYSNNLTAIPINEGLHKQFLKTAPLDTVSVKAQKDIATSKTKADGKFSQPPYSVALPAANTVKFLIEDGFLSLGEFQKIMDEPSLKSFDSYYLYREILQRHFFDKEPEARIIDDLRKKHSGIKEVESTTLMRWLARIYRSEIITNKLKAIKDNLPYIPQANDIRKILEFRYGLYENGKPLHQNTTADKIGRTLPYVKMRLKIALPLMRALILDEKESAIGQLTSLGENLRPSKGWTSQLIEETIREIEDIIKNIQSKKPARKVPRQRILPIEKRVQQWRKEPGKHKSFVKDAIADLEKIASGGKDWTDTAELALISLEALEGGPAFTAEELLAMSRELKEAVATANKICPDCISALLYEILIKRLDSLIASINKKASGATGIRVTDDPTPHLDMNTKFFKTPREIFDSWMQNRIGGVKDKPQIKQDMSPAPRTFKKGSVMSKLVFITLATLGVFLACRSVLPWKPALVCTIAIVSIITLLVVLNQIEATVTIKRFSGNEPRRTPPPNLKMLLEKMMTAAVAREQIQRFKTSDKPVIDATLTTLVDLAKSDLGAFLEKAKLAQETGASSLHVDIFDPKCVETSDGKGNMDIFNGEIVKKITSVVKIPVGVHLVVRPSTLGGINQFKDYIDGFINNGASFVSIHLSAFRKDELDDDVVRDVLRFIGERGAAGLVVNPDENAEDLLKFKDDIDFPLIMTVVPGAGGKSFDERGLANLKKLKDSGIDKVIAVDGGITDKTIGDVVENGGKWLIVGSYYFGKGEKLKSKAEMKDAHQSLLTAAQAKGPNEAKHPQRLTIGDVIRDPDVWTPFWKKGHPTTIEIPYSGVIKKFWVESLERIATANPRVRILDICTGNLPIPFIAKEISAEFDIIGIDTADIDDRYKALGAKVGIKFLRRPAENTAFESNSFDVVTGCYALEYTKIDEALKEMHRVLKEGGYGIFVVHHPSSITVGGIRENFEIDSEILQENIYEHILQYIKTKDEVSKQKLISFRERLIKHKSSDRTKALKDVIDMAILIGGLESSPEQVETCEKLVKVAQETTISNVRLLESLLEIGVKFNSESEIESKFKQFGFEIISLDLLKVKDPLLGWGLLVKKTSPSTKALPTEPGRVSPSRIAPKSDKTKEGELKSSSPDMAEEKPAQEGTVSSSDLKASLATKIRLEEIPQKNIWGAIKYILLINLVVIQAHLVTSWLIFKNFKIGETIWGFKDWFSIGNYADTHFTFLSSSEIVFPLLEIISLEALFVYAIYKNNLYTNRKLLLIGALLSGGALSNVITAMLFGYFHLNYFSTSLNLADLAVLFALGGLLFEISNSLRSKVMQILCIAGWCLVANVILEKWEVVSGSSFYVLVSGILWGLIYHSEPGSEKLDLSARKKPLGSPAKCVGAIVEYLNLCGDIKGDVTFSADDLIEKGLRKKKNGNNYSLYTVKLELRLLHRSGVLDVVKGTRPYRYMLRADIRNLSPPQILALLKQIQQIPELNHYDIPEDVDISKIKSQIDKLIKESREKEALYSLLEDMGLNYPETCFTDIKNLPEVRKVKKYREDLLAFVNEIRNNLDHPDTILSLAYQTLMEYLDHPAATNLGRHAWIIEDLKRRLPDIIEKKLASDNPKDKVLTVWDLGCGHLEPVLLASVILEEFDKHENWGKPGDKIKVVIKAVDVGPKVKGKINKVLKDGFPHDAEGVLLGKRATSPAMKKLIKEYIGFVNKKKNRERIKELGLIEVLRKSIAYKKKTQKHLLYHAVKDGDIFYISFVFWNLSNKARMQVLRSLKNMKEGTLAYIRDLSDIKSTLDEIGIETTRLSTPLADTKSSSPIYIFIKGKKESEKPDASTKTKDDISHLGLRPEILSDGTRVYKDEEQAILSMYSKDGNLIVDASEIIREHRDEKFSIEVDENLFVKVHIFDNRGKEVKTYTYEPYIEGFEGQTIPFIDSTEHDACYWWVKEKVDSGEWGNDYTLINFDFHSDDYGGDIICPSNWAMHLKQKGLIGSYWWVYSNSNFDISNCTDFKTGNVSSLPYTNKPVVVTIDLDYFLYYLASLSPITTESIDSKIKSIVDSLISKGYNIKGINITCSPEYIEPEWETYAVRKLAKELQRLPGLGSAKIDMRLQSVSYAEADNIPLKANNVGKNITGFCAGIISSDFDLPNLKLALNENNPLIRISACRAITEIGTLEAVEVLLDFISTETDPDVIKAAAQALNSIARQGTFLEYDIYGVSQAVLDKIKQVLNIEARLPMELVLSNSIMLRSLDHPYYPLAVDSNDRNTLIETATVHGIEHVAESGAVNELNTALTRLKQTEAITIGSKPYTSRIEALKTVISARSQKTDEDLQDYYMYILREALAQLAELEFLNDMHGNKYDNTFTLVQASKLDKLYTVFDMTKQSYTITFADSRSDTITSYVSNISQVKKLFDKLWEITRNNDILIKAGVLPAIASSKSDEPQFKIRNKILTKAETKVDPAAVLKSQLSGAKIEKISSNVHNDTYKCVDPKTGEIFMLHVTRMANEYLNTIKENLGGLFVDMTEIFSTEESPFVCMVDGVETELKHVYVQKYVTPLISWQTTLTGVVYGGKLKELIDAGKRSEAEKLLDKYFERMEKYWQRGVVNTDEGLHNVGAGEYVNVSDAEVLGFDLGYYKYDNPNNNPSDWTNIFNGNPATDKTLLDNIDPSHGLKNYYETKRQLIITQANFDAKYGSDLGAAAPVGNVKGKAFQEATLGRKNNPQEVAAIKGRLDTIRERYGDETADRLKTAIDKGEISLTDLNDVVNGNNVSAWASNFMKNLRENYNIDSPATPAHGMHFWTFLPESIDEGLKIFRWINEDKYPNAFERFFTGPYKIATERLDGLCARMTAIYVTPDGKVAKSPSLEWSHGVVVEKLTPLDKKIESLLIAAGGNTSAPQVQEAKNLLGKLALLYQELIERGAIDTDTARHNFLSHFGLDRSGNVKVLDFSHLRNTMGIDCAECLSESNRLLQEQFTDNKMGWNVKYGAVAQELYNYFFTGSGNCGLVSRVDLSALPQNEDEIKARAVPMSREDFRIITLSFISALSDSNPKTKINAINKLGNIGTPEAVEALSSFIASEPGNTAESQAVVQAAAKALKALSETVPFNDYGVRYVNPEVLTVMKNVFGYLYTYPHLDAINIKLGVTFAKNTTEPKVRVFLKEQDRHGNWSFNTHPGGRIKMYGGTDVHYDYASLDLVSIYQSEPEPLGMSCQPVDLGSLTIAEASKLHQIMQNEPDGFYTTFTKAGNTYKVHQIDGGIEVWKKDASGVITIARYRQANGYAKENLGTSDSVKFGALGRNKELSVAELLQRINNENLWIQNDTTLKSNLATFSTGTNTNAAKINSLLAELNTAGVETRFFKDLDVLSFRQGNIVWLNEWLASANQANAPPAMAVILEGLLTHETKHNSTRGSLYEEWMEETEAVTAECQIYTNAIKANLTIKDNIITLLDKRFGLNNIIADELLELAAKSPSKPDIAEFVTQNYDEFSAYDYDILHPAYVGHCVATCNEVNPNHEAGRRGVYNYSGAGLSGFLLSTDTTNADFVDIAEVDKSRLETALDDWDKIRAGRYDRSYKDFKYFHGYGFSGLLQQPYLGMERAIILELKLIGAKRPTKDDITVTPEGHLRIQFKWTYPGTNQEKTYTITFKDKLKDALKDKIDIYYQRVAGDAPKNYASFMSDVGRALTTGAYCITDDFSGHDEHYPEQYLQEKGAIFTRSEELRSPFMLQWENAILSGLAEVDYGWHVKIRQKLFNTESDTQGNLAKVYDDDGIVWEEYTYKPSGEIKSVTLFNPVMGENIRIYFQPSGDVDIEASDENGGFEKIGYLSFVPYSNAIWLSDIEITKKGKGIGKAVVNWLALKAYREKNKEFTIPLARNPKIADIGSRLYNRDTLLMVKGASPIDRPSEYDIDKSILEGSYKIVGGDGETIIRIPSAETGKINYTEYFPADYTASIENKRLVVKDKQDNPVDLEYTEGTCSVWGGKVDAARITRDMKMDNYNRIKNSSSTRPKPVLLSADLPSRSIADQAALPATAKQGAPTADQTLSMPTYRDIEDFINRHIVGPLPDGKGSYKTVKEIIGRELPAALYALNKIIEAREWMDNNGASARPLIIWQNMRLGAMYPYFTENMKKQIGIIELTPFELTKFLYHKKPLSNITNKTRYILIKEKLSSESPGKTVALKEIKRFARSLAAPIVLVDHSYGMLSAAQVYIVEQKKQYHKEAVEISIARRVNLQKKSKKLEQKSFFIVVNPNQHPLKLDGVSSFNDSNLFLGHYSDEQKITVSGREWNFYDIFRKVYGEAIEEAITAQKAEQANRQSATNMAADQAASYKEFIEAAEALSKVMPVDSLVADNVAPQVSQKAIVLYADDVLERGTAADLAYTLKETQVLDNSTLILYGRKPGGAELLEKIINESAGSKKINVIRIETDDLQGYNGYEQIKVLYPNEAKELELILKRLSSHHKINNGSIFGVIKGMTNEASVEDVKKFACERHLPVVSFRDDEDMYSFKAALAELIAISNDSTLSANKEWFSWLKPIEKEDIEKAYQDYRQALDIAINA